MLLLSVLHTCLLVDRHFVVRLSSVRIRLAENIRMHGSYLYLQEIQLSGCAVMSSK